MGPTSCRWQPVASNGILDSSASDLEIARSKIHRRNGLWRFFARHYVHRIPQFLHVERFENFIQEPYGDFSWMPPKISLGELSYMMKSNENAANPLLDALSQCDKERLLADLHADER